MPLPDDCQLTCPAGASCRAVKFGAIQYCRGRAIDPATWDPLIVAMAERDRDRPAIPRPAGWTAEPAAPSPFTEPAPPPPIHATADHFRAPLRFDRQGNPVSSAQGVRTWEGGAPRKPWDYAIAAAIVHLDAPGMLLDVIETLRAQTVRPYIHVIDTGSLDEHQAALRALMLSCDDVEVTFLNPRGWQCTSQPCAVAMDVAFALCQSPYMYATHTDVFLKRPDYLEYLLGLCDERTPAVGYQMSPRPAWGRDDWRNILSHTGSIYHMPSMRKYGVTWNMLRAFEHDGIPVAQPYHTGYPDTEVALGQTLQARGVGVRWLGDPAPGQDDPPSVLMLGPEENRPYETEWLVHQRSYTSHAIYHPAHAATRRANLERARRESRARVARWRAEREYRTDAELVRSLTDAQAAAIEACPARYEDTVAGCCGPQTRCRHNRIRSNATASVDCAKCQLAGGPLA